MKTTQFLFEYIQDIAIVTIMDTDGYILYEGTLENMPYAVVKNSKFIGIEGFGVNKDLIITIDKN